MKITTTIIRRGDQFKYRVRKFEERIGAYPGFTHSHLLEVNLNLK